MKDRYILANVLLAFEAIEWSKESKQNLVIMLLDFEKAYDRVNWTFLKATMRKMSFSEVWIHWTASLYRDAESSVLVNGKKMRWIQIQRSVRQGCFLAPYLYLFVSEVLTYTINDVKYGIRGLRLPDGSVVRIQCFADDTALFLHGDLENLEKVYEVLGAFCKASGAKINWGKSFGVWVPDVPRSWRWGEVLALKWLEDKEVARYLGFPFGKNIFQQDKDAKVLFHFRSKLNFWSRKKLSLKLEF